MPGKIDSKRINKVAKPDLLSKANLAMKPDLATDLNIVLSKGQIENIVKGLMEAGQFGDLGQVALAGDYCCVDASVGSSVAGPFSSVGSAVSCDPGMPSDIRASITQKLTAEKVRVNVMLPQELRLK